MHEKICDLFIDNIQKLLLPEMWAILDLPLSKAELMALLLIGKCDEITVTRLAGIPEISESSEAGVISSLVQKGYAQRTVNESDETETVRLTPNGVAVAEHIKQTAVKYLEHFTDSFKCKEKELFRELFSKIFEQSCKADSKNTKSENPIKNIRID